MIEPPGRRRYDRLIDSATDSATDFAVDLPLFSGPFRLLATLILDQKVDVCDVPLARITDRFLRRGLEDMQRWNLEESTWFLALCALLLELKVGRLLPRPSAEADDELLGGVSPDLLYARSLELAAFRRIAGQLAARMSDAARMVPRVAGPPPELAHLYPDPMEKVTVDLLASTAATVFAPPARLDLGHMTPIRVSLHDALVAVADQLTLTPRARFRDLLGDGMEKIDVVIRFLAVLELYREGKVELTQASMFGDIAISWQGGSAPDLQREPEGDGNE